MKSLAQQHAEILDAISKESIRGRTKRLRALQVELRQITTRILAKEVRKRLRFQRRAA